VGEYSVQSQRTAGYDKLLEMLRETRELRGVSQRELSKQLGQDFTYMFKIERGVRRVDVVELIQICLQLGISPTEFVANLADAILKIGLEET